MSAASGWRIYLHPRVIAVMLLGFSSGLPLLLIGGTLGAWLTEEGVSKTDIGLFALVAIPYSFNFCWAPLIDRLPLPLLTRWLGRRRAWMLVTQIGLMVTLWLLSQTDPSEQLGTVAWLAVILAFLSASQDVVIDAYRTEYLDKKQYGEGAAMAVFGYRLGMLAAGAGALAMADSATWQLVYMVMGALMLVGMLTMLVAGEPENTELPPRNGSSISHEASSGLARPAGRDIVTSVRAWIVDAVVMPFANFASTHNGWWLILLFILFYRMSDGFIGFITTPFFLDIGFTKSEVAAVAKVYGFGATLLGMFLGGYGIRRLGLAKCLWLFLLTQVITNLGYAALAATGPDVAVLMATISMDNLSGGMITAAAIAYMMSLCNPAYTATQYALLSSLASLASKTIAGGAGWLAETYGWVTMFGASALLGIPAFIALRLMFARRILTHSSASQP